MNGQNLNVQGQLLCSLGNPNLFRGCTHQEENPNKIIEIKGLYSETFRNFNRPNLRA
jgi:hypothetical protein